MRQARCGNDNHGRAVVTVRFCANCGVVVNERIRTVRCPEAVHGPMRRSQSTFCVHCGEQLVQSRSAR